MNRAHTPAPHRPHRIRPAWALGAWLALLVTAGVLLHWQAQRAVHNEALMGLQSAADLGAHALNIWMDERRADVDATATSPLLRQSLARALQGDTAGSDLFEVLAHFDRLREVYGYRQVALIDLQERRALNVVAPNGLPPAFLDQLLQTDAQETTRWVEWAGPDGLALRSGLLRQVEVDGPLSRFAVYVELDIQQSSGSLARAAANLRDVELQLLRLGKPLIPGEWLVIRQGRLRAVAPASDNVARAVEAQLADMGWGIVQGVDATGAAVLAGAAPVAHAPWSVVASQTREHLQATARARSRLSALTLSGLFVVGALVILLLQRGERVRALHRESELRRQHAHVFQESADAILMFDAEGRILDANAAADRMYGYPRGSLVGEHISLLRPPSGHAEQQALMREHQTGGGGRLLRPHVRADGSLFTADVNVGVTELDGKPLWHAVIRDVTARQASETQRRIAASFFQRSNAAVLIADATGTVQMVNPAFTRVTGFALADLLGQAWAGFDEALAQARQAHAATPQGDGVCLYWEGERMQQRADGQSYPSRVILTGYADDSGQPDQYVMVHTDLSRLKTTEAQLLAATQHDALTGLPNRRRLDEVLATALAQADSGGGACVLALINLDRWSVVNQSLGLALADQALSQLAQRLHGFFGTEDTVFRYGGDEFVALLRGEHAIHYASELDRLLATLLLPLAVEGRRLEVSASVGVSVYPALSRDAGQLLQHANAALRVSKVQGRNTWRLYEPSMAGATYEDLALASDLRQAAREGGLSLHYQPQYGLHGAQGLRLIGFEALLRWNHPQRGPISPVAFIPLAESTGLIVDIGRWVLQEACRTWRQWADEGLQPPTIAVNISGLQFHHATFLQDVRSALLTHQVPPEALELELTESLLMSDTGGAIDTMMELARMGLRLAIDDFGTGYSSLSYLKRFPVHKLKIDRSFVMDVEVDGGAIAVAVIHMAKSLRLAVIAEGVETQSQIDFLRRNGCDEVQGYLCGRPEPREQARLRLGTAGAHNDLPVSSAQASP